MDTLDIGGVKSRCADGSCRWFKRCKEKKIPMIGEVELAYATGQRTGACNHRYEWKDDDDSPSWRDHEQHTRKHLMLWVISVIRILLAAETDGRRCS